jgi:hypothetical protein
MKGDFMKVIVKEVGKKLVVRDIDCKYRNECGDLIEKNITKEYVTIKDKELYMVVDEDGINKNLSLNFLISTNNPFYPVQIIVGDVVFCRIKWENPLEKELYDFEVADITEEDLKEVAELLDVKYQRELATKYFEINL